MAADGSVIHADAITFKKIRLANDVAASLGLSPGVESNGATVLSELLGRIYEKLLGRAPTHLGAYAKTAAIMESLGLTYDPIWDTSEHSSTGGSTVTARAYSKMRAAVTGQPRCFIVNTTDAEVGAAWESGLGCEYAYGRNVSGRVPFNEAGPGSLIIYYSTSSNSTNKMSYVASARVDYVRGGRSGPWVAELSGFEEFPSPVPAARVEVRGRNVQNAITEIGWDAFRSISVAGGARSAEGSGVAGRSADQDPGGARGLRDFELEFPVEAAEFSGDLDIPLEDGPLPDPSAELTPQFTEANGRLVGSLPRGSRSRAQRDRDKLVEERAVGVALRHFANLGWLLESDRQKDGVGYDLDLSRGVDRIHLEVKGIQSHRLQFNVTAKEWWRIRSDRLFVLAAVTEVLSPTRAHVNILGRRELFAAQRSAVQFRLSVER